MSSNLVDSKLSASRLRLVLVLAVLNVLGVVSPATAAGNGRTNEMANISAKLGIRMPVPACWHNNPIPKPILDDLIRHMTLEEKVGQLLVTRVYGDRVDTNNPTDRARNRLEFGVDTPAQVIQKYHFGGITYFGQARNVRSPHQVARLSNGIQRVAAATRMRIPILISTDQEQGLVVRIGPPATQFPGNMSLGAGRRAIDAFTAASITGRELKALGINQDLAPVADVNLNPANPVIGIRSFGSDPRLVSEMTAAQVQGYQLRGGVSATAKHFPGHGDTDVDSHFGFPVITHTRSQWESLDAPPFRAAIESGVDTIMTAHIQFPALDPSGDPATLSRPIVTGLLRGELRYQGVVVTDALGMQGVRTKYGDARVPVLALQAGVDQLLDPPDLGLAYDSVLRAVRQRELSEERIEESVSRILRMKWCRGLFARRYVNEGSVTAALGGRDSLAAAEQITEHTTTLVKNDAQLLPLAAAGRHVLVTGWSRSPSTPPPMPLTLPALAAELAKRHAVPEVFETGAHPTKERIDRAVIRSKTNDVTLVTTNDVGNIKGYEPRQQQLVKALVAAGKPVIVLSVGTPYDIAYFSEAPTYLASYSHNAVAMAAAVRVILGEVSPSGRLPVRIPAVGNLNKTLYQYGYGMQYRR